MDIDLRDRGILRLCFREEETNEEEATVASAVAVLLADHNQICHVSGLEGVFVNLVELRLSHNQLGRVSTPYYRVNHSVLDSDGPQRHCCDGLASWIRALPKTMEVLDVAYNHLHSFLECTCAGADGAAPHSLNGNTSPVDEAEQLVRRLRHSCPFAVPLFFTAARFPHLRELHLSHNAFAVNLRESDEMQGRFESSCTTLVKHNVTVAASEALALLDLSFNEGVAAVNSFFLSTLRSTENKEQGDDVERNSLCTVNVTNTALDDLQGIATMGLYRPSARWSLQLHPSPLERNILSASASVLIELLRMVVSTLEDTNTVAAELMLKPANVNGRSASAMDSFQSAAHLAKLEELAKASIAREAPHMADECSNRERWVATLAYVCLLHQVIPSLEMVDGVLSVSSCEMLLLTSLKQLLCTSTSPTNRSSSASSSRLPPMSTPPLHPHPGLQISAPLPRGLGVAANAVAPELRSRAVVHETNAAATSKDQFSENGVTNHDAAATKTNGTHHGRFRAALAALRQGWSSSATPATNRTSSVRSDASSSVVSTDEVNKAQAEDDNCSGSSVQRGNEDFFTPSGLAAEDKALYEALCVEAKELQAAVLASTERCRGFREQADALRQQLTQDRTLVADQLKEITRLRQEKKALEQGLEKQQRKLEKRQKEVAYGVTAIQSREAAAREKAAVERIAAREKEIARRERQLRQRAARVGALAVEYHNSGPSGECKKLRSEVLREAAVRRRLAEQENKDPLAYSPAPFKSDARCFTPRSSAKQKMALIASTTQATAADEERAYFNLYGSLTAPGLQEVADHYVAQLSVPQQQQLREASPCLSSSGNRDATGSQQRSRGSSAQLCTPSSHGNGSNPHSDGMAESSTVGLGAAPEGAKDLSSLSLSELLDAAAAIRQKQLALQQLQQQWKQPLPPPPMASINHENTSPAANGAVSATTFKVNVASLFPPSAEAESDDQSTQLDDTGMMCQDEHGNSPFRSIVCEETRPSDAQQLFDMVLAQRSSSHSRAREGEKGGEQAVPPMRSPFSSQPNQGHLLEEDSTTPSMDDACSTPKDLKGGRLQINRALFC